MASVKSWPFCMISSAKSVSAFSDSPSEARIWAFSRLTGAGDLSVTTVSAQLTMVSLDSEPRLRLKMALISSTESGFFASASFKTTSARFSRVSTGSRPFSRAASRSASDIGGLSPFMAWETTAAASSYCLRSARMKPFRAADPE